MKIDSVIEILEEEKQRVMKKNEPIWGYSRHAVSSLIDKIIEKLKERKTDHA